ncbi:type II toxin-antitoxin system prevent-host-death family antitoxin [Streptomyces fradiae]|uniref:type II toxin-antitoxin system Phd/YefM family antitoxin n=1 Tax=Streptomyces fradiae TaxID=1906 RepID=UPI0033EEC70D
MTESTLSVRETRARFAHHVDRAVRGEATVIARDGAPVAALVPFADFEALEEAADMLLEREAVAVLAEGGPTVGMAELLAELSAQCREGGDGRPA